VKLDNTVDIEDPILDDVARDVENIEDEIF
jgi:hypothetical protein